MKKQLKDLPAKKKPLSVEDVKKTLIECRGYQYLTAERLGVSGACISQIINKNPELKVVRDELMEIRIDKAEIALESRMLEGKDITAIIFFLKTIGKKRGYCQEMLTEDNLSAIKSFMDMHRD